MIKKKMIARITAFSVILMITFAACKKNEDDDTPSVQKKTYTLGVKDLIGVTGTVSFEEKSSGSFESVVIITLTGAPAGNHPAHIHMNSAAEGGPVTYALNAVDGTNKSTTTLSVPFATLVNYDGYVNVHLDEFTLGTLIAQGDIGGNELTGTNKTYTLMQDSTSTISGKTTFQQRKNGATLVTIDLTTGGNLPAGLYPAYINLGSIATVGAPVIKRTLNPVDGIVRTSLTNVRTLNDGTPITYANWLVYTGYMTIHDAADTTNIIAKGNIGSN